MSKIRINDLARELEVKSKSILDVLPEIGVTEKKSHSSSLEDHEAEKVRARLRASSAAQTSSRSSRPTRADADEIKTKIDLSHISKPGDALKAIISKQQPSSTVEAPPAAPPPRQDLRSRLLRQRRPLRPPPLEHPLLRRWRRPSLWCRLRPRGPALQLQHRLLRNRLRLRLHLRLDRQFHRRLRHFRPAAQR